MASTIDCDGIVSTLETIHQRGHSRSRLFDDWLDLMLFALQRRDDPYLDIVDDYREPRDMDHPQGERTVDLFATAFAQLQKRMAETDADVLGAVYEKFGMQSDAFGQHFTPTLTCEMKAKMLFDEDEQITSEDRRPRIADPACGSGRLLIAAAKQCPDGIFVGQDVDSRCARMAALNFCFFNLTGYVIRGDSLKIEVHRAWKTAGSPIGGEVEELHGDNLDDLERALEELFEDTGEDRKTSAPTGGSETAPSSPSTTETTHNQQVRADGDPDTARDRSLSVHTDQSSLLEFDTDG